MFSIGFQESECVNCDCQLEDSVNLECGHIICVNCYWKDSSIPFSCCDSCWEFSCMKLSQNELVMHPEGEGMCVMHWEKHRLFCDWNKTVLCVTCSNSEEHRHHVHWPIGVAAMKFRQKIKSYLPLLDDQLKHIQQLQEFVEKERPLSWIVKCTYLRDESRKTFDKKVHLALQNMKGKEKISEKEEIILRKVKENFDELYPKLKEAEAIQECKILEQKKEWLVRLAHQRRLLTNSLIELQEVSEKPDLEMLQVMTESLNRSFRQYHVEHFIPRMNNYYVSVLVGFLKFYHRFKLVENYKYNDLADGTGRSFMFTTDTSGNTLAVYTTGRVSSEFTRDKRLLRYRSQEKIVDKEGCTWNMEFYHFPFILHESHCMMHQTSQKRPASEDPCSD